MIAPVKKIVVLLIVIAQGHCIAQYAHEVILSRAKFRGYVPSYYEGVPVPIVRDANGRWWWLGSPIPSVGVPVRQEGEPTPTLSDTIRSELMLVDTYGYSFKFNERSKKFDHRYVAPDSARDKHPRQTTIYYYSLAADDKYVYAAGRRLERFSVRDNRWLEPLEYWESDSMQWPTIRYFTKVVVTPRGVFVSAHSEYVHPTEWWQDKRWFELYRVESNQLTLVMKRRTGSADGDVWEMTPDGSKLILWLMADPLLDRVASNPEIIDMNTGESTPIMVPWEEFVEDISWYPIPFAIITGCDDRYVYFVNDRMGRTKRDPSIPNPKNCAIIRYDLEQRRIDAISEVRIGKPSLISVVDSQVFLVTRDIPYDVLEVIRQWRPWPSAGLTPREQLQVNDTVAGILRYTFGITCGSPVFVTNYVGDGYMVNVKRLLDTTSSVRQVPAGEVTVQPNPASEGYTTIHGVEGISAVIVWNAGGQRVPTTWSSSREGSVTVWLQSVSSGVYWIELRTENGQFRILPVVVIK